MPFDDIRRQGPGRGSDERAINLPPALLWLIVVNVAVHLVRQTLSDSADQSLVLSLGLVPANYTSEPGGDWSSLILAPITYQFIHGGWVHLGVNMLTLAAFGAPVERLLGVRRFCSSIFRPAWSRASSTCCSFLARPIRWSARRARSAACSAPC